MYLKVYLATESEPALREAKIRICLCVVRPVPPPPVHSELAASSRCSQDEASLYTVQDS